LSDDLTKRYNRGFSVDNLEAMRIALSLVFSNQETKNITMNDIKQFIESHIPKGVF